MDTMQLILADQNLRDIKPVMDAASTLRLERTRMTMRSRSGVTGGMSGMLTETYSTSRIRSSAGLLEEKRLIQQKTRYPYMAGRGAENWIKRLSGHRQVRITGRYPGN